MGRKTLILTLIAVFVAFPVFAELESIKVGGQLRIRHYLKHRFDLDKTDTNDQNDYTETRARLYFSADLTENVFGKITTENYLNPWQKEATTDGNNTYLQEAYIQLKDVLGTMGYDMGIPLELKIGRQFYSYGKYFLLAPLYGVDGVKATVDLKPFKADFFAYKLDETAATANDDRDLYGIWGTYSGITDWTFEPYLISRKDRDKGTTYTTGTPAVLTDRNERRLTYGLRTSGKPITNLSVWADLAMQDGTDLGKEVDAFGCWLGGTYTFADMTYKPALTLQYMYGSGDKDTTDSKDKAFDQLYEFVEWGYTFDPKLSNLHIISACGALKLTDALSVALNYYNYRQDEKSTTVTGDITAAPAGLKKDLGDELDLVFTYKYTADVSTELYLAYFDPGKAYASTRREEAFSVRAHMQLDF
ncbi:MAG: alginate export family protein [Candidatus Omnitrophota bacterium]